MLLFGFFNRDLTENLRILQQQQSETNITVYRQVALLFLDGNILFDCHREKVLFEINIDSQMISNKPFANISSVSSFVDEAEVLFMVNTLLKVNNIERTDQMTTIQLTLCNENDHELTNVYKYLTSEQNDGSLALGDILLDVGQFAEANRVFLRLLSDLQSEDMYNCYNQLGIVAAEQGNYQLSIDYFQKAFENINDHDPISIATTCLSQL